jgi:hypothetical protein
LISKYAKVDKDLPRESQFEKIISLTHIAGESI